MTERSPVTARMGRLDNPVWHALAGPQATLAEGSGRAFRFRSEVSVFAAVPDDATAEEWSDLADLIGAGKAAVLFRATLDLPPGWTNELQLPTAQMAWADPAQEPAVRAPQAEELGAADVDDMMALVKRTEPGPFLPETYRMGTYLGLRDRGRLIAMAGERLQLGDAVEISAVCTDPEHQGRGLAGSLVGELTSRIQQRGGTPFLHAATTNHGAIRVYDRLGFVVRSEVQAAVVRAPQGSLRRAKNG